MPQKGSDAMKPEFFLVLDAAPSDDLANAAFEAGFDDSVFTSRGGRAAIEVFDRNGSIVEVVEAAIRQAEHAGLRVAHVEVLRDSFLAQTAAE